MQVFADVTGVVIERVAEPQESGARGAALIAALGLGHYRDFASIRDVVRVSGVFAPRDEYREVYDEQFDYFKDTYYSLKKLYRRMNRDRQV
jgi:xylulokinase